MILGVIIGAIAMIVLSEIPILGPILAGFIAGLIAGGVKRGILSGFFEWNDWRNNCSHISYNNRRTIRKHLGWSPRSGLGWNCRFNYRRRNFHINTLLWISWTDWRCFCWFTEASKEMTGEYE